jgi:hypothetical protein
MSGLFEVFNICGSDFASDFFASGRVKQEPSQSENREKEKDLHGGHGEHRVEEKGRMECFVTP